MNKPLSDISLCVFKISKSYFSINISYLKYRHFILHVFKQFKNLYTNLRNNFV